MKRLAHESAAAQDQQDEEIKSAAANQAEPTKRVNMPKKNKHRMHAHINPFAPLHMPTPQNTRFADWSLHYPSFYESKDNNQNKIVVNTKQYPIEYPTEAAK